MYNQRFAFNKLKSRDRQVIGYSFFTMLGCLIKMRDCYTLRELS